MRHCRTDYEAIQPWPTARRRFAKVAGVVEEAPLAFPEVQPIIPDDEPVFVLRSADVSGPDVVRYWADRNEADGGDPATVERVRRWADEMEAYGVANGTKVPDTPLELLRP